MYKPCIILTIFYLCSLSLLLGIYIGKTWRSKNDTTAFENVVSLHDAKQTFTSDSESFHILPVSKFEVDSTTIDGIILIRPALDIKYEQVIEIAKTTILSIIGLSGSNENEKYSCRPWSLMPSGSTSSMWACPTNGDGILLRTSLFVKSSASRVLQWLIGQNIVSGLEGMSDKSVLVESIDGGCVMVKKIRCSSESVAGSKVDFTVLTSVSMLPNGIFIIASRSINLPATVEQENEAANIARGIIYASGFVLRPLESSSGCEVFYAGHLNMSEASQGLLINSKQKKLASSVLSIMEMIDEGCEQVEGTGEDIFALQSATMNSTSSQPSHPGSDFRVITDLINDNNDLHLRQRDENHHSSHRMDSGEGDWEISTNGSSKSHRSHNGEQKTQSRRSFESSDSTGKKGKTLSAILSATGLLNSRSSNSTKCNSPKRLDVPKSPSSSNRDRSESYSSLKNVRAVVSSVLTGKSRASDSQKFSRSNSNSGNIPPPLPFLDIHSYLFPILMSNQYFMLRSHLTNILQSNSSIESMDIHP